VSTEASFSDLAPGACVMRCALAMAIAAGLVACGATPSGTAAGSYTGTTQSASGKPVAVRLDLQEGPGGVTGSVFVMFPGATDFQQADSLTGARTGDDLHLVGATGIVIDARRSGSSLSGTVTFKLAALPDPPPTAVLKVDRT